MLSREECEAELAGYVAGKLWHNIEEPPATGVH